MKHITVVGPLAAGRPRGGCSRCSSAIGSFAAGQSTVVEKATNESSDAWGLVSRGWPGLEVGWVIRRSRWATASDEGRASPSLGFEQFSANRLVGIIPPGDTRSIASH